MNDLLNTLYQNSPEYFDEEEKIGMEVSNALYGNPLATREQDAEFNLNNTVRSLFLGFLGGFTTLPLTDLEATRARNPYERVAESFGHLLGFIGFIPGPGLLGKLAVSQAFKGMGFAKKLAPLSALPTGITVKSLPMFLADKAMGGITKVTANAAGTFATDFMKNAVVKDMARGATHLGIASAFSAAPIYDVTPDTFINQRLSGLQSGAIFGAGNAVIGNLFAKGGWVDLSKNIMPKGSKKYQEMISKGITLPEIEAKREMANAAARALSSGLTFGMMSTLQGAPLEIQVYEYLVNAFFGWKEIPSHIKEARGFIQHNLSSMGSYGDSRSVHKFYKPEEIKGFYDLGEKARDEVKAFGDMSIGQSLLYNQKMYSLAEINLFEDTYEVATKKVNEYLDKSDDPNKKEKAIHMLASYNTVRKMHDPTVSEEEQMDLVDEYANMQSFMSSQPFQIINDGIVKNADVLAGFESSSYIYDIMTSLDKSDAIFREFNMPNYAKSPLDQVADEIVTARIDAGEDITGAITDRGEIRGQIYGKVHDRFFKDRNFEDTPQAREEFFSDIKTQFNLQSLSDRVVRNLNRGFSKILNNSEVRVGLWDKEKGTYEPMPEIDIHVNKIPKIMGAQSFVSRVLGGDVMELSKVNEQDPGQTSFNSLFDAKYPINPNTFIHQLYSQPFVLDAQQKSRNTMPIMGMKAKDSYLIGKAITDATEFEPIYNSITTNRYVHQSVRTDIAKGYQQGLDRYIAHNTKNNPKLDARDLMHEYNHVWANSMAVRAKLDGFDTNNNVENINDWLSNVTDTDGKYMKGFIIKSDAYNKRGQMYDNKFTPTATSYMKAKLNQENYNYILIDHLPIPTDEARSYYDGYGYKRKAGDTEIVPWDAHFDGGSVVRSDVFQSLMEYHGGDQNSGNAKIAQLGKSSNAKGVLMTKEAAFEATGALDLWMKDNKIDFIINTKGAKAWGNRKVHKWTIQGGKFTIAETDMTTYDGIWEDMRYSFSVDTEQALHNQRVLKQMMTHLGEYDEFTSAEAIAAKEGWLSSIVKRVLEGTPEGADAVDRYIKAFEDAQHNESDEVKAIYGELKSLGSDYIRQIPLAKKFEVLRQPRGSALYKDIMADVMNTDGDALLELADTSDIEYLEMATDFLVQYGGGRRFVKAAGSLITPQSSNFPMIKRYVDSALRKYFIAEMLAPRVPGSFKLPFFVHDFGGNKDENGKAFQLKPGEVYLSQGLKQHKVKLGDEYVTLEEVDRRLRNGEISEYEIVSERVPTSSKSGVRVLKFKGFVDRKGLGFIVHPEEYAKMDGADNDIDTAFFYTDLPANIKGYYKKYNGQYLNRGIDGIPVFQEPKTSVFMQLKSENKAAPYYAFDPVSYMYSARNAAVGKKLLGQGQAWANRVESLFMDMYYHDRTKEILGTVATEGIAPGKEVRENVLSARNVHFSLKPHVKTDKYGPYHIYYDSTPDEFSQNLREAISDNYGIDPSGREYIIDIRDTHAEDTRFAMEQTDVDAHALNMLYAFKKGMDNYKGTMNALGQPVVEQPIAFRVSGAGQISSAIQKAAQKLGYNVYNPSGMRASTFTDDYVPMRKDTPRFVSTERFANGEYFHSVIKLKSYSEVFTKFLKYRTDIVNFSADSADPDSEMRLWDQVERYDNITGELIKDYDTLKYLLEDQLFEVHGENLATKREGWGSRKDIKADVHGESRRLKGYSSIDTIIRGKRNAGGDVESIGYTSAIKALKGLGLKPNNLFYRIATMAAEFDIKTPGMNTVLGDGGYRNLTIAFNDWMKNLKNVKLLTGSEPLRNIKPLNVEKLKSDYKKDNRERLTKLYGSILRDKKLEDLIDSKADEYVSELLFQDITDMTTAITNAITTQRVYDANKYKMEDVRQEILEISQSVAQFKHMAEGNKSLLKKIMKDANDQTIFDLDEEMRNADPRYTVHGEDDGVYLYSKDMPEFAAIYKHNDVEYVVVGGTMQGVESQAENSHPHFKRLYGANPRNRKAYRIKLTGYNREDPIENYRKLEEESYLIDKGISTLITKYTGKPDYQSMIITRLLGSFNYKRGEFADHVSTLLNAITNNAVGGKTRLLSLDAVQGHSNLGAFANEIGKSADSFKETVKAKYSDVIELPTEEIMGMYSSSFNVNDRIIKEFFSSEPEIAKALMEENHKMRLAHNTAVKTLLSVKKWWLSSNFNSYFFNKPFVPPAVWGNFMKIFQRLTDITFMDNTEAAGYFGGLKSKFAGLSVRSNTIGSKVRYIQDSLEHDMAARLLSAITGNIRDMGGKITAEQAKNIEAETKGFLDLVTKYGNGEDVKGIHGETIKKNVPDDVRFYLNKMKDILAKSPALLANFEGTYVQYTAERFGMPTNFQNISYRELIDFVKYLDGLSNAKYEGGLKVGKSEYYMLPEIFNKKHLPHDPSIVPIMLPVWHPRYNKTLAQEVYVPMAKIGQNYKALLNITQYSDSAGADIDYELNKENYLGVIKQSLANQHPDAAIDIFEYAYAKRTRKDSPDQAALVMDRVRRKYGKDTFSILDPKTGVYEPMGIDKLAKVIDAETTTYFQGSLMRYVVDRSAPYFKDFTRVNPDKKYTDWVNVYGLMDEYLVPSVINGNADVVNFGLNGIQKIAYFDSLYRTELPLFEENNGKRYLGKRKKTMLDFIEEGKFEEGAKWLDELSDHVIFKYNPNGIGGTTEMTQPYEWLKRQYTDERIEMFRLDERTLPATQMYFPRMGTSEKELQAIMKRNMEEAVKRGDKKEAGRIYVSMQRQFGSEALQGYEHVQDYIQLMHKRSIDEESFRNTFVHTRPRHLMGRDYDNGIKNYRLDLAVLGDYAKSLKDNYYKKLSMIVGNRIITKFEEDSNKGFINIDKENIPGWVKFMRMNLVQSIGGNSLYPKDFVDDPTLHIKDSGYYYFTDQAVADKITKANKFFGIDDIDNKEIREAKVSAKLAIVSNLEAKWSLLTLLTRPKSAINNLFGGNLNIAINVGLKPLRMSYDINYLTSLNPEWKNMADVEQSIDLYGGIEAFVKAEAGLNPELRGARMRRFVERVRMKLREDPEVADSTLQEIAKQEGIFNEVVNAGAWFMRKSERLARRQAWLAHYIKAREVFQASGSKFAWNDPWLIETANRGVHATQFLYNAVNRPMFAKTALGKMFTRFQIWAYNSLNFRVQIAKDAFRYGYSEGSAEYQRFERMALADLFVMGAAMFLPMSLFGSSIPTPWAQMGGIAQFLFGDDEQKERAFYGVLPYPLNITQVILPPSSRYFTGLFTTMMTNDWDKFASFHIWSWFPFGAVGMDVKNAVMNPSLATERLLAIPYNTLTRKFGKLSHPYSLFDKADKSDGAVPFGGELQQASGLGF